MAALAMSKEAINKNGIAGKIGKIIPIAPTTKNIEANAKYNPFFKLCFKTITYLLSINVGLG